MVGLVVFDSLRGPESVLSHLFFAREPTRSLPYKSPDLRGPRFLVTQNRSGATPSESALSFPPEWLPVVESGWEFRQGPVEGRVS